MDLLARVEAVGRDASGRSAEIERLRRLPDDISHALVTTGFFRAWVPARYGGAEADAMTVLDALREKREPKFQGR